MLGRWNEPIVLSIKVKLLWETSLGNLDVEAPGLGRMRIWSWEYKTKSSWIGDSTDIYVHLTQTGVEEILMRTT